MMSFIMPVEDVFSITGRGTVATGRVERGVLKMGEKFHAVPWAALNYDEEEDAYVVPYTKDELKSAPSDTISELTKNDGIPYRDQSHAFYKVDQYWT